MTVAMAVARDILKLTIGGGCVLGSLAFPSLVATEGMVWGNILATALGNVAAGNTANAIDALIDAREGGVSLENQDLTKAVGKAIAAVITLAAKQQGGKTRQYLEKIAAQAKDNWVAIAQQELTQQRYPELREAKLDQFLTPEEYQLTQQGNLTATEWGDIFIRLNMAACKGGGFPIPSEVRQQVAELLHTTFPKALRETLKEDFANDGKAFAGLTLQLLTGMQAQLRQLQANQQGVNVEEFSQMLQQFQELETQLRGSVSQQQAFFREVSRGIESGFAEVCERLGVMETTISELLQTLEERLEELRQEVTDFRQEVRQGLEALHNQPGGRQFSKQEYRNRQNILTQMRTEVESRLTQSIHRAAFVNLGKEQQPQQVQRPWDMSVKVGERRSVQLPPQTTILDVFDNPTISGKFLILGKPGGGKSTTLLELAEALIERAERDSDAPIPVILELSSWQEVTKPKFLPFGEGEKYDPSIKEWVLSQLISKGVSQDIGEQWLREKELVLLLDGLDELQPQRQGKCVRAINQFLSSEFSPLHLVVCSRKEEYEDYEEILQLNGAICLEDLTNEQIRNYFTSVNLGEFWESIKGSDKIVDFIRQPLFLAVTSIAYEQIDVEEWRNCNTEERAIDYLLGVYRVTRLNQQSAISKRYQSSHSYFQNKLTTIALYLNTDKIESQELVAATIQPSLLSNKDILFYMIISGLFLFSLCLPVIHLLVFRPPQVDILMIDNSLISLGLIFVLPALAFSLPIFLPILIVSFLVRILVLPLRLFFSIPNTKKLYEKSVSVFFDYWSSIGSVIGCVCFLAVNFSTFLSLGNKGQTWLYYLMLHSLQKQTIIQSIVSAVAITIFYCILFRNFIAFMPKIRAFYTHMSLPSFCFSALTFLLYQTIKSRIIYDVYSVFLGLFMILYIHDFQLQMFFKFRQNLELYTKFVNTSLKDLWIGNAILFLIGFLSGTIASLAVGTHFAIGNGVLVGLLFSLFNCFPYIQYFSLRLTLWLTGQMPWNITRFLDYCTERLILQRVGNRYRFIHRLVQEHFAKLEIQKH
ncbi:NACHT domain-containing protein [Limnospira indica]|uniref:NTPase (NACHT family)-like protein n=1 Tax=Limnospira indica PCC 8005 TaxID=376219 RepID=A0A9P1P2R0_9CYAN|nr:NACHT domain-containing protein [Limnospira indica]CDM97922.1 NTPase (NACHT family)-like protein [Limnospira indica PCC 8005]